MPTDLAARLVAAVEAGAELACAASDGRIHPVVALWPVAIRAELRAALRGGGERKVGAFVELRAAVVRWPTLPHDPFYNVNAPQDVETAEAIARRPL